MRVDARPATASGSTPGCQSTTACPSTSMPRRPARPVSWVYSPGVTSAWVSPFHLTSFSRTTERAGMLTPSARVSVAKTALTSPRENSSSTTSLKAGSSPAWWAASPRSRPSAHSQYPRTARSSSGMSAQRASTTRRISSRSSGVVSRTPQDRHCWTAASQAARLKMKVIAGSRPARSSCPTTSARLGVPRPGRPRGGRRPRPRWVRTIRLSSRDRRISSGLTRAGPGTRRPSAAVMGVSSANRSYIRWPTMTCCHRGTGRCSETTTSVSPRTVSSQSPNSSALLTVADSETTSTSSGRWMITSSHTAPRNRSAR